MSSLSVIIPAYNEEESLKVLMPDLLAFINEHNLQLIIVNDGSKDNSEQVISDYKNQHPKATMSANSQII